MCLRKMEEGERLQIMVHEDTVLRGAGWEKAPLSQGRPRSTSLVHCKMGHYKSRPSILLAPQLGAVIRTLSGS